MYERSSFTGLLARVASTEPTLPFAEREEPFGENAHRGLITDQEMSESQSKDAPDSFFPLLSMSVHLRDTFTRVLN